MDSMYSFTDNGVGGDLKEFLEEAELQQYYDLFRDILKVTKLSQLKYVVTEDLVQIGLSKPEQRRYKKNFHKYFPNPYISKIKKLLSAKKNDATQQTQPSTVIEFPPFVENDVKGATKHIIPVEDITINKELGMGQFGVVQQGTWNTGSQRLQVAIKCLGHERMTPNSTEFLKEAAVMHSISHPNIVRLYGVVLHLDSLMLVTELAPLRSLLECLREVSLRSSFPVRALASFAEQICDGMTYLENKRLIHRDLAARNILVFSKDRVKISDFGLSRALGVGKDYYQTNYNVNLKLPVAWCAPECILYLKFTSASDVWAFGVCLWEMFTYGFQPWAAFSGQQILEAIDAPNHQRLERPECCPQAYYTAMMQCWAHEPADRPRFRDLALTLRDIRPEQLEATCDYQIPDDGRRANFLEYKSGQLITVLGKESMTESDLWYGVLDGGACGVFDPKHTKPYVKPEKPSVYNISSTLSPSPARQSARLLRPTILRHDVKRHTYTGKRSIQRCMISAPQGEVKHTGHVGLDGAYFGDISFLDPAQCPPRQVVTPYKPSEDLEQQPLINPNSPSHLSPTPYPLLAPRGAAGCDELDLAYPDSKTKSFKKTSHKLELNASKSLLNKVKSATLGRAHRHESTSPKQDEVHEYTEISDTDTESTATDNAKGDNIVLPESPGIPKSTTDFSQSLLDEIESMFRSYEDRRPQQDFSGPSRHFDIEHVLRSQTMKHDKKKGAVSGPMKQMSSHDAKTLESAVALANEIITRSMNDLGTEPKVPTSPSEKKFHFKFPLVSLHHHNTPAQTENNTTGKQDRRNFSEQANSVPDIQASITAESKMAYTSLIEEPSPSTLLTMPTDTATTRKCVSAASTLMKSVHQRHRSYDSGSKSMDDDGKNELPLPPRTTKPKLVDKPRHVRKYPLKMPIQAPPTAQIRPIIYQNMNQNGGDVKQYGGDLKQDGGYLTQHGGDLKQYGGDLEQYGGDLKQDGGYLTQHGGDLKQYSGDLKEYGGDLKEYGGDLKQYGGHMKNGGEIHNGVDVCDAVEKCHTNPFTNASTSSNSKAILESSNMGTTSSVNPFSAYIEPSELELDDPETDVKTDNEQYFQEGSLVKDCTDHVSVEDLLEFADQKPCGRQRGLESDEVRIMRKVLKQQVTPEECLEALEVSEWNVHTAIKVVRVRQAAKGDEPGEGGGLDRCRRALLAASGDVVKAAALIRTQRV